MRTLIALLILASSSFPAHAEKECWMLTNVKGRIAPSNSGYQFLDDGFSTPMLLCFDPEKRTGSVSGDDTQFTMLGTSTLSGWVSNRGIELLETFQIDRSNGKVLFTKSRIGTATVLTSMPDVVAAYVGIATRAE